MSLVSAVSSTITVSGKLVVYLLLDVRDALVLSTVYPLSVLLHSCQTNGTYRTSPGIKVTRERWRDSAIVGDVPPKVHWHHEEVCKDSSSFPRKWHIATIWCQVDRAQISGMTENCWCPVSSRCCRAAASPWPIKLQPGLSQERSTLSSSVSLISLSSTWPVSWACC